MVKNSSSGPYPLIDLLSKHNIALPHRAIMFTTYRLKPGTYAQLRRNTLQAQVTRMHQLGKVHQLSAVNK